ncbi:hypothetical protein CEP54_016353 [Fusarium duplospermum]|uniref:Uncharacterized protein n=1 Tax=Fusarium duplospermum TaxID=1325734 RepID=A0A428NEJ7_9HYPO|nr:hypothetical protein CEP54_016353 [Fusarium duplospermum]
MIRHVRGNEMEAPADQYPESDEDIAFYADDPEPRMTARQEERYGSSGLQEQPLERAQRLLDQLPTRRNRRRNCPAQRSARSSTYNRILSTSLNRTSREDTEPMDLERTVIQEHMKYDQEITQILSDEPPSLGSTRRTLNRHARVRKNLDLVPKFLVVSAEGERNAREMQPTPPFNNDDHAQARPGHPEHQDMSWINCIYHDCEEHLEEKQRHDTFPRRIHGKPVQNPYQALDTEPYVRIRRIGQNTILLRHEIKPEECRNTHPREIEHCPSARCVKHAYSKITTFHAQRSMEHPQTQEIMSRTLQSAEDSGENSDSSKNSDRHL